MLGRSRVTALVEKHTGRMPSHVEFHGDPKNRAYYAIRAWIDDELVLDFLFDTDHPFDGLEDVVFESWPPLSDEHCMEGRIA